MSLSPFDAFEVDPDHTLVDTQAKKKQGRKEKRQRPVSIDDIHPSTKIKALLGDLVASSRQNPHSETFDPSAIEIEEVDEHGNGTIGSNVIKTVVL